MYPMLCVFNMHISDINNMAVLVSSFARLRWILDAEIKDVHATGIKNTKAEKEPVSDDEEERMWQEHHQMRIYDITIESKNTIVYGENTSKHFTVE